MQRVLGASHPETRRVQQHLGHHLAARVPRGHGGKHLFLDKALHPPAQIMRIGARMGPDFPVETATLGNDIARLTTTDGADR